MISATELAALQATANSAMDLSITIKRATRTTDGTGHYSDSWATVTTVNGNLAQPTGNQMQNYGYLVGPLDTWMVRVPYGTNLQVNDRLVIGSQTLRVQILLQPQSYQTAERVLGTAIQPSEVD